MAFYFRVAESLTVVRPRLPNILAAIMPLFSKALLSAGDLAVL